MSIRQHIRQGRLQLRFIGTVKSGYRLVAQDAAGHLSSLGPRFTKESDAKQYGERKLRQIPKRLRAA